MFVTHFFTYKHTHEHLNIHTQSHTFIGVTNGSINSIHLLVCLFHICRTPYTHKQKPPLSIIFQSNLFFAKFYHCHLMGEIHQKDKTIFNVWHPPILTVDFLLLKRRIKKTFCNTSKLAYFVYYVSCKMSLDT